MRIKMQLKKRIQNSLKQIQWVREAPAIICGAITYLILVIIITRAHLDTVTLLYFAPIVAFLSFWLFRFLYTAKETNSAPTQTPIPHFFSKLQRQHDLLFAMTYFILICIILLVPTSVFETQFVTWPALQGIQWARLIAGILLTAFIPGYALIQLIDRKGQLKSPETILFSYILSCFLIPLVGFLILTLNLSLLVYGQLSIIFLHTILLSLFIVITAFRKTCGKTNKKPLETNWKIDYFDLIALIFVLAFTIASPYAVTWNTFPLLVGDAWNHYGWTMSLLTRGFIVHGGVLDPTYPWWFHVYLATAFLTCGIAPINTYIALNFLNALPILGLYAFLSVFFKEKYPKLPATATILACCFMGFGWLYYFSLSLLEQNLSVYQLLRETGNITYDLWINFNFSFNRALRPAEALGFSTFLAALFLLGKKNLNDRYRYSLLAVCVALGYLSHPPEIGLLLVVIFVILLSRLRKTEIKSVHVSIASLSGLSLVLLLDLLAPAPVAIASLAQNPLSSGHTISVAFLLTIILSVIILPLDKIATTLEANQNSQRIKTKFVSFYKKNRILLTLLVTCSLLFVFYLSFIIWFNIRNEFNLASAGVWSESGVGYIPWYFYPMRFGVLGFLTIIATGMLIYSKNQHKQIGLFVVLLYVSIVGTHFIATELQFFAEFRFAPIQLALLSPIAAFGLITILHAVRYHQPSSSVSRKTQQISKISRTTLAAGLLVLIIIGGTGSDLFATASYGSDHTKMTYSEWMGLEYLFFNREPNDAVIAASPHSDTRLHAFSAVPNFLTTERPFLFLTPQSPEMAFYSTRQSNFRYLYENTRDLLTTQETYRQGLFNKHLREYLPLVYQSQDTQIYSIPNFAQPNQSNVAIITPKIDDTRVRSWQEGYYDYTILEPNYLFPIEMLSLANCAFSTYCTPDLRCLDSNYLILPNDLLDPLYGWIDGEFTSLSIGSEGFVENYTAQTDGDVLTFSYQRVGSEEDYYYLQYTGLNVSTRDFPYLIWRGRTEEQNMMISTEILNNSGSSISSFTADTYISGPLSQNVVWHLPANQTIQTLNVTFRGMPDDGKARSYWLDYVGFKTAPTVDIDFSLLQNWTSSGGTLLVFDSYGLGTFAQLLSIQKTNTSEAVNGIGWDSDIINFPEFEVEGTQTVSTQTNVIAEYSFEGVPVTPFAYERQYGTGKIIYVEIKPYFLALQQHTSDNSRRELFSTLGSILGWLELPEFSGISSIGPTAQMAALGPVTASGEIIITSGFGNILGPDPIVLDGINLAQATISPNSSISTAYIGSPSLRMIEVQGPIIMRIETDSVEITSFGRGPYSILSLIDWTNYTISLLPGAAVTLRFRAYSTDHTAIITNGKIGLIKGFINATDTTHTRFVFYQPTVSIRGEISFDTLSIKRPNIPRCHENPASIEGELDFTIAYSEGGLTLFSSFEISLESDVIIYSEPAVTWNEWNIRWYDVDILVPTLSLLVAIGLCSSVVLLWKGFEKEKFKRWLRQE